MSTYKAKQIIVMRKDLQMRKGKIAAQAGHACVQVTLQALMSRRLIDRLRRQGNALYIDSKEKHNPLIDWFNEGVAKVCVYVNSEAELLAIAEQGRTAGFIYSLVRDAGLTEFHGEATLTCLAFEPLYDTQIDPITGELPLY